MDSISVINDKLRNPNKKYSTIPKIDSLFVLKDLQLITLTMVNPIT
jgi:hypothetical protein